LLPGGPFIIVNGRCRVSPSVTGLIALALFAAVYGYGVVRELNIELDRSPAMVYETTVLKKKYLRSAYGLHYAAWGLGNREGSIHVTRSLAHSVHAGDSRLHGGEAGRARDELVYGAGVPLERKD
jgi:hypothetical protein